MAFYEASVQIIPVLFLVIAIEFDLRATWPYTPRWVRLGGLLALLWCALAEGRALYVLLVGDAGLLDAPFVGTVLMGLAAGIIVGATGNPFAPTRRIGGGG